jgi:beta-lactamase class A
MRQLLIYVFLVALTSDCTGRDVTQPNNSSVETVESQNSKIDQNRDKELLAKIEQIASAAKGKVGVAAVVIETGESVSLNPNDRFPMQSVYKLPIGMAALSHVDAGKLKLDQKVRVTKSDYPSAGMYSPIRDKYPDGVEMTVKDLVQFAISKSDSTASDVLIGLVGGARAVQDFLTQLKIKDWIVLNTEKEIGQDWQVQYRNSATPEAAVALLRAVHFGTGLSESSHALVLKFMTESIRAEKRLKALLPAGTVVAHKTGTSGTRNGVSAATNNVGIITLPNGRHVAIAVFVSDSRADEATREGVIAKVARAVWDAWGK